MSKIHEKIMRTDFARSIKKLIILTVCVCLLGGGLSAVMLAPQIREIISNVREWKQDRESRQENDEWEGGFEHRQGQESRYHEEDDFLENVIITKPTTAAIITVGITGLLGSLCIFFFWLLIAAWLYQAAVRSGMNGPLWLAAGMFGSVFTAIAFLLIRSFVRKKCPSCGAFVPAKVQYCSNCGAAIYETCEACKETCACNDNFCHACGNPLHGKAD